MAAVCESEVIPAFIAEVSGHIVIICAEVIHPADTVGFQDKRADVHLPVAGTWIATFDGEVECVLIVPIAAECRDGLAAMPNGIEGKWWSILAGGIWQP